VPLRVNDAVAVIHVRFCGFALLPCSGIAATFELSCDVVVRRLAIWTIWALATSGDARGFARLAFRNPLDRSPRRRISSEHWFAQALHQAIGPGEHGHGMDQVEDLKVR
jgi:hypothetical protein